jgi:hypothetical protein
MLWDNSGWLVTVQVDGVVSPPATAAAEKTTCHFPTVMPAALLE